MDAVSYGPVRNGTIPMTLPGEPAIGACRSATVTGVCRMASSFSLSLLHLDYAGLREYGTFSGRDT